ncbi:MAG TPA: hypothetical protein PKO15_03250 [Fibrobacteria bacterium]|nr:hypothetical protein [Fibrobacteria bacterium]HOX49978.1 hypothetical protein [Fibrobacteria bacterium]
MLPVRSMLALFATSTTLVFGQEVPSSGANRVMVPADNSRLSFAVLHTKGHNWLQARIESVGPCQQILLDSVWVADSADASGGGLTLYLGGGERRTVGVRWNLAETQGDSRCAATTASKFLEELPRPRKHPRTDSLLGSWAPGKVVALGPGGRLDTLFPEVVDQASDLDAMICPLYDCQIACLRPDSAARAGFLENLRTRIGQGASLVRIAKGGDPERVVASLQDTQAVLDLGQLSKWNAGDLVWGQDQPLRTVRSWGKTVPTTWKMTTGRRFYRWRTDTVAGGILSQGTEVEVSNDSTDQCWAPHLASVFDRGLTEALGSEWLILTDSSEVADGRLRTTFRVNGCGARERSWQIDGDSVVVGCVRVALADLDRTLSTTPRQRVGTTLVMSTAEGLRVRPDRTGNLPWSVVVRDAKGRFLARRDSRDFEESIALSARGILVVEVRTTRGTLSRMVAR